MISFLIGFGLGAWFGFGLAAVMVVRADEKHRGRWR